MITEIASDRLVPPSDRQLGNPFSHARRSTVELIEWASREGCDICVNGDGFDNLILSDSDWLAIYIATDKDFFLSMRIDT